MGGEGSRALVLGGSGIDGWESVFVWVRAIGLLSICLCLHYLNFT